MSATLRRRAALAAAAALSAVGAPRPGGAVQRSSACFRALCRRHLKLRADLLDADRRLDAAVEASGRWQGRVHELEDAISDLGEAIEQFPAATPDEAAQRAAIVADGRRLLSGGRRTAP